MSFSLSSLKGSYLLSLIAFAVIFLYSNYTKWKMGDTKYDYITPSLTAVFTTLAIFVNNTGGFTKLNDEILMGGYPSTE